MLNNIVIATRSSPLALWQANWVKSQLINLQPDLTVELLELTTSADRKPYLSLAESGGKGLFVKELEEALLQKRADIAVHSLKDMPMSLPQGLVLAAFCKRELPFDVLVSEKFKSLANIPDNAVIGTASLRRQAQLLQTNKHLTIKPIRGNVGTRLNKLTSGEFDALILAGAGLKRLNLNSYITEILPDFTPAAGQGVLTIECRSEDLLLHKLVNELNHVPTQICVQAERDMCKFLNVGCQMPVAAFAELLDEGIKLTGVVASKDGQQFLKVSRTTNIKDQSMLGELVGKQLLDQGADKILADL